MHDLWYVNLDDKYFHPNLERRLDFDTLLHYAYSKADDFEGFEVTFMWNEALTYVYTDDTAPVIRDKDVSYSLMSLTWNKEDIWNYLLSE
jgi:hypothetical protein